jgi:hypothetical protein
MKRRRTGWSRLVRAPTSGRFCAGSATQGGAARPADLVARRASASASPHVPRPQR